MRGSTIETLSDATIRNMYADFEANYKQIQNDGIMAGIATKYNTTNATVKNQRRWFLDFKAKGGDLSLFLSGRPRVQCFVTVSTPKPEAPKPEDPKPEPTKAKAPDARQRNQSRLELASAIAGLNAKLAADRNIFESKAREIADKMHNATGPALIALVKQMAALEAKQGNMEKEKAKLMAILPYNGKDLIGQDVSFFAICSALGVDHEISLSSIMFRNTLGFITEEQQAKLEEESEYEAQEAAAKAKREREQQDLLPAHLRSTPVVIAPTPVVAAGSNSCPQPRGRFADKR
jgi:hypothetical protein